MHVWHLPCVVNPFNSHNHHNSHTETTLELELTPGNQVSKKIKTLFHRLALATSQDIGDAESEVTHSTIGHRNPPPATI